MAWEAKRGRRRADELGAPAEVQVDCEEGLVWGGCRGDKPGLWFAPGLVNGLSVGNGEGGKGDEDGSHGFVWTAGRRWQHGLKVGKRRVQQVWCGDQECWFGHVKLEKLSKWASRGTVGHFGNDQDEKWPQALSQARGSGGSAWGPHFLPFAFWCEESSTWWRGLVTAPS